MAGGPVINNMSFSILEFKWWGIVTERQIQRSKGIIMLQFISQNKQYLQRAERIKQKKNTAILLLKCKPAVPKHKEESVTLHNPGISPVFQFPAYSHSLHTPTLLSPLELLFILELGPLLFFRVPLWLF